MARKHAKQHSDRLLSSLETISKATADGDEDTGALQSIHQQYILPAPDSQKQPRMKKFRFQLLSQWLAENFQPCKAADVGGGKGLLSFLLAQAGWSMTVIDPVEQPLPTKYKDIAAGRRVRIDQSHSVKHISEKFMPEHAADFDLLIGMHAHGCNAKIIDAAAETGAVFVLFPCCVIDEPFYPRLGVHWLESLADYAVSQGHNLYPFRLNFKGQNIGLVGGKNFFPTSFINPSDQRSGAL